VEKLTCPTPEVPCEAVFQPASPLPDIGFPPLMEIPGLTVNQTIIDDFLNWSSFDWSWPHGGYKVDIEKGMGMGCRTRRMSGLLFQLTSR